MKIGILIGKMLCTMFMVQSISVSAQSIRFSEFHDLNQGAGGFLDVALLGNGDLLAVGNVLNLTDNVGYSDGFHVLVNAEGELIQSNGFASVNKSYHTQSVVKNPLTNTLFSAGYFCDFTIESPGYCDFYISKLDATGDTLFTKVLSRPDTSDFLLDMVQTRPNKLMLIGWTYNDTTDGNADLLFITGDTLGNELNRVVYGGGGTDYVNSGIVVDDDGNVLMTGYTQSFGGSDNDTWVLQTDSIGNVAWHKVYNHLSPSQGDGGGGITALPDGNYAVAGAYDNASATSAYGFIMKIDSDGNELWTKRFSDGIHKGFWACKALATGEILACGQAFNTNDNSQTGWLVKTDANGDTLWTRTYNASQFTDLLRNMIVLPNGDIVMVGFGRAPGQTNQDGWILRVDSMGCLQEGCFSVGVKETEQESGYFKVYPNPFSSTTTIEYNLGRECEEGCEIRLYDLQGQIILKEVLHNTNGVGQLTVDLSSYGNGIYYCSLYGNQQLLQTEKLILMK